MGKRLSLIVAIAIAGGISASAAYVTQGDKSVYTFEALSNIEGSGVTKVDGKYCVETDIEIGATDTLRIQDEEIVNLGDKVQIKVLGYADFAAPTSAKIGRISASDAPKGIYIFGEEASGEFKHLSIDYCGIRTYGNTKGIIVDNCTFNQNNGKMSSSGAIVFGSTNGGNEITNCTFISSVSAAIAGAANSATGLKIKNCMFVDCNTGNSNRPAINVTVGGDNPVIIEDNTIIGNKNTKVGGIGVGNMLSMSGTNEIVIKNNKVSDCRYGLTTIGPMSVTIEGNILINNRYETDAMNGGSGMSLYDPTGKQTVRITDNYIEGSLWGITVIGCGDVNIGKTVDESAADYNPGRNVFVNNGNGGMLYDLYNNSTNTVYAQGNMWNVNEQTPEEIAKVITDKSDVSSLGEVICDNPTQGAVRTEPVALTAVENFDKVTLSWQSPKSPIELKWHDGEDYNGFDGIRKDPQGQVGLIMASRFTASELSASANKVIEAIDYFEYRDFTEAYAQIYENGKLVRNQKIDLTGFEKNTWRSTTLEEPYVISGNDEIIIGIKYKAGYNQTYTAITDRYATKGKGNIVSYDDGATWNADAPGDFLITAHLRNITTDEPKGYAIVRDKELLTSELITDNVYTIAGNADGEHKYTVQAVYDDGFVRSGSVTATTMAVTSLVPAPAAISGSVDNGLNGTITWQAPLKRAAELTWSNKTLATSIGATATTPKLWVKQEFDANDLIAYPDYQLTAVNAYFTGAVPTAMTLFVMKNGKIDYFQALTDEEVAAITADSWNKFALTTPYKPEAGNTYAFGYYITHAKSLKPVGVDTADEIATKGNSFSTSSPSSKGFDQSSPSWKTLASGDIHGNFMLTADVEPTGEVAEADEIAGYDVYADGELLAGNVTETTFSETVDKLGEKTYTVIAKGTSGKTSPAKSITLEYTLPEEYTAPQMISTEFNAETGKVDIEWSNDAVKLSHCGDPKYSVSFDEDLDIAYGAKFTAEELSQITGYRISEVKFIQGASSLAKSNLEIYAGSELLYSYDIRACEPNTLYTMKLATPVIIPEGKDLYIAYNSTIPSGTSAIVIDNGPAIEGGAVISYNNGKNWLLASAMDADLANYNFVISAQASPAKATSGAQAVTLGMNGVETAIAGTIKAHHSDYGIEAASRSITKSAHRSAAIKSNEVAKYRIYRNYEVLAETTAKSFSEVLTRHGEYIYAVTNVYANGWESPLSKEFYVDNHIAQKPQAPYNLRGEAEGRTLNLAWEAIDAESAVLKYHNGNYGNSVGMTSTTNEGYQAILFSADNIATMNKAGEQLTHIKFHLSSTELTFASVMVMLGNNVVYEQNIDLADLVVGWNVVRLDNPFTIPAGFDVKIGYHVKYAKGVKPLSTDDGPAAAGFGDLISASTYTWYSLATKYKLNYNFLIEGICSKSAQVLKAQAQGKTETEAPAVTYSVYCDGVKVASDITDMSYTVNSAADGAYTVTATIDGVESAESNAVEFTANVGVNGVSADSAARYDRNIDAVVLPEAADAEVYAANGALMKTATGALRVDMSDLPAGVYFVKTSIAVVKVVK